MAQQKDQRKVHGWGNSPMPYKRTKEKLMVKEIAPCPFESKTFDEVCLWGLQRESTCIENLKVERCYMSSEVNVGRKLKKKLEMMKSNSRSLTNSWSICIC